MKPEGHRSQDEQRRLLLDSLTDHAIFMIGPDGVIESWSRGGERVLGYPAAEAIGQHFSILYPPEERPRAAEELRKARETGRAEDEGWRLRKDGARLWASSSLTAIRDEQGGLIGFASVTRDLTGRRNQEPTHLSDERFRLMVDTVRDYAIFMLDPDGRVATWNAGAERIKQYRADEIIGHHFSQFYPPEDVQADKPGYELRVAAAEGRFEDEGFRVRKDGSRFWANVILTALREPSSGKLVGFAKVTRDLTERRKIEEERVRLAQAEEAIRLRDEFLSIASHELKTPLTALHLQLQSVQQRVEAMDAKLASKITRATRSSSRLADLVEALLDVSRIATGRFELQRENFDLSAVAQEVIDRMRESALSARCQLDLATDGPIVGAWDRLRIEQVLSNLLANAFKYGAGGKVEVTLFEKDGEGILQVRDQGPGIPAADMERIFGRFERAVSMRHFGGMGLGLYVTRQIVDAHGGSVSASNPPGGGALFTVRLPLGARSQASPSASGELH